MDDVQALLSLLMGGISVIDRRGEQRAAREGAGGGGGGLTGLLDPVDDPDYWGDEEEGRHLEPSPSPFSLGGGGFLLGGGGGGAIVMGQGSLPLSMQMRSGLPGAPSARRETTNAEPTFHFQSAISRMHGPPVSEELRRGRGGSIEQPEVENNNSARRNWGNSDRDGSGGGRRVMENGTTVRREYYPSRFSNDRQEDTRGVNEYYPSTRDSWGAEVDVRDRSYNQGSSLHRPQMTPAEMFESTPTPSLIFPGLFSVRVSNAFGSGRDFQSQLESIIMPSLILAALQQVGQSQPAHPPLTKSERMVLEFQLLSSELAQHLETEGCEECTVCQEKFRDIWQECVEYAACPSVTSEDGARQAQPEGLGPGGTGAGSNPSPSSSASPSTSVAAVLAAPPAQRRRTEEHDRSTAIDSGLGQDASGNPMDSTRESNTVSETATTENNPEASPAVPEQYHRRHDVSVCRLPCNHFFCGECLLKWMAYTSTCPNCRLLLEDLAGKYVTEAEHRPSWWEGKCEPALVEEIVEETNAATEQHNQAGGEQDPIAQSFPTAPQPQGEEAAATIITEQSPLPVPMLPIRPPVEPRRNYHSPRPQMATASVPSLGVVLSTGLTEHADEDLRIPLNQTLTGLSAREQEEVGAMNQRVSSHPATPSSSLFSSDSQATPSTSSSFHGCPSVNHVDDDDDGQFRTTDTARRSTAQISAPTNRFAPRPDPGTEEEGEGGTTAALPSPRLHGAPPESDEEIVFDAVPRGNGARAVRRLRHSRRQPTQERLSEPRQPRPPPPHGSHNPSFRRVRESRNRNHHPNDGLGLFPRIQLAREPGRPRHLPVVPVLRRSVPNSAQASPPPAQPETPTTQ